MMQTLESSQHIIHKDLPVATTIGSKHKLSQVHNEDRILIHLSNSNHHYRKNDDDMTDDDHDITKMLIVAMREMKIIM